ncbi:plastocyanin/azurin family copper-binding protein [Novipirellula sp. SH528]|uniref:plastocyanin/azurin family copper-binding protein n=1 Tax=Novipirellula sp. SH528 TaxID=3454466 RepID=UPI003F9F34C5
MRFLVVFTLSVCSSSLFCVADDHSHGTTVRTVQAPTVFLDKSPRIVAYQLNRLDSERLLMVPRQTDDVKYIPVYEAILSRDGMSPQFREESVAALAKLRKTSIADETLAALGKIDLENRQGKRTAKVLAEMLLDQPVATLKQSQAKLEEAATDSQKRFVRAVGLAGLIQIGDASAAWSIASADDASTLAWLDAVGLVPDSQQRRELRGHIVEQIQDANSETVRNAAITEIANIPSQPSETFDLLAPFVSDPTYRSAAVRTLLRVPVKQRPLQTSQALVATLVDLAESTEAAQRTTAQFVDAMQLADQMMASVPVEQAKSYRNRLREVTVRVVRIRAVEEEMRYDIPYFAVEAGRPVQIVLENHDLMPHNLVVTAPGALKEVAQAGAVVGSAGGWNGLPFVPELDSVLSASQMVQPDQTDRITFNAPTEPGEYPYVCTFPQHWYRMYGVMVVVKDLDAWMKDPVEPANPIGSNRAFVQAWKLSELQNEIENGMKGRSAEIGARIFAEASCQGCHKVGSEGGVIGPDLTEVFTRYKGDRAAVLREIIDPSHKVEAKYAMHQILTVEGRVVTGIILNEDKDNVTVLENPEAKEPTVISQDDIEEMVQSPNSMMPKGLMDQYTQDEIFEMLSFLENADPNKTPAP